MKIEKIETTEAFLDWLVAIDIQHYQTAATIEYIPSGASHFYLKGSPERFTSAEMIQIFHNRADDELNTRWNYAMADCIRKKK